MYVGVVDTGSCGEPSPGTNRILFSGFMSFYRSVYEAMPAKIEYAEP